MRALRLVAAFLLTASVSCTSPTGPEVQRLDFPADDLRELDPPPAHLLEWYRDVEECADLEGDAGAVRWWAASEVLVLQGADTIAAVPGAWTRPHNVFLREDAIDLEGTVRHEALHDLLRSTDHPEPPFGTCAPLEGAVGWP